MGEIGNNHRPTIHTPDFAAAAQPVQPGKPQVNSPEQLIDRNRSPVGICVQPAGYLLGQESE